jgi:hypothetical protein
VLNGISQFDKKMRVGADLAVKHVEHVKKLARDHNTKVKETHESHQAVEYHFDLAAAYKGFTRLRASEKARQKSLQQTSEQLMQKRAEKHAMAQDRLKNLKLDHKERFNHLMERQEQMGNLMKEVREAYREEVDQKKEISLLKKKDQIENYERGKNFHNLYKQKLVERLLEKKERADRVKDQQRRIASMCATQRVRVGRTLN